MVTRAESKSQCALRRLPMVLRDGVLSMLSEQDACNLMATCSYINNDKNVRAKWRALFWEKKRSDFRRFVKNRIDDLRLGDMFFQRVHSFFRNGCGIKYDEQEDTPDVIILDENGDFKGHVKNYLHMWVTYERYIFSEEFKQELPERLDQDDDEDDDVEPFFTTDDEEVFLTTDDEQEGLISSSEDDDEGFFFWICLSFDPAVAADFDPEVSFFSRHDAL